MAIAGLGKMAAMQVGKSEFSYSHSSYPVFTAVFLELQSKPGLRKIRENQEKQQEVLGKNLLPKNFEPVLDNRCRNGLSMQQQLCTAKAEPGHMFIWPQPS